MEPCGLRLGHGSFRAEWLTITVYQYFRDGIAPRLHPQVPGAMQPVFDHALEIAHVDNFTAHLVRPSIGQRSHSFRWRR